MNEKVDSNELSNSKDVENNYKLIFVDITKKFLNGKVIANNKVNLSIDRGKITSLVGENGSGKSTLTSILFGLYKQDSGQIKIDNNIVDMYQSGAAKKHRIGMVHQHFHLVDKFTVLENIILGQEDLLLENSEKKVKQERIKELENSYNSFFHNNQPLSESFNKYYDLSLTLRSEKFKKYRKKQELNEFEKKLKELKSSSSIFIKIKLANKDKKIIKIENIIKKLSNEFKSISENVDKLSLELKNATNEKILKIEEIKKELDFLKIDLKTRNATKFGFLNYKKFYKRFDVITNRYGINLSPDQLVSKLNVGDRQKVEILKTLWVEKDVIIFDEATATLSVNEIKSLLKLILKLKEAKKTILFISHKLQEVKQISDNIAILKKGNLIGSYKNDKTLTIEKIAKLMVGMEISLEFKKTSPKENSVLKVENLTYFTAKGFKAVDNISFEVYEGEIFGLAGIEGNGQEEIFNCIAGLKTPTKESKILYKEKNITNLPIVERNNFISHIPIDRFKHGIVLEKSLLFNSVITTFNSKKFSKLYIKKLNSKNKNSKDNENNGNNLFIDNNAISNWTIDLIKKMNVDGANDLNMEIRNLSGGNQQKFVIAREILRSHKLLLAGHPTRGLDIKSIKHIYNEIINDVSNVKSTILYSLEINELMAVCNRLAILYKGKIVKIIDPKKYTLESVSKMFVGLI